MLERDGLRESSISTTTVLLGAGASVEAGLPTAAGLTSQTQEWLWHHLEPTCGRPPTTARAQAFDELVKLAKKYDIAKGMTDPVIDIERIFSLCELLQSRDDPDVGPVIERWRNVPTAGLDIDVAGMLMTTMQQALRDLLTPSAPDKFDYLQQIFGMTTRIATLNMDCGVEQAAKSARVPLSLGMDLWRGGVDWKWESDEHRLLKLHGSIDRHFVSGSELSGAGETSKPAYPLIPSNDDEFIYAPGVIFGRRGKFRPEGPFLAMWLEFRRWLTQTRHLVVCGYSFRDTHINHLIEEWSTTQPGATLSVIDPALPAPLGSDWNPAMGPPETPNLYHAALLEYEACKGSPAWCPNFPTRWLRSNPELVLVRQGANEGLTTIAEQRQATS